MNIHLRKFSNVIDQDTSNGDIADNQKANFVSLLISRNLLVSFLFAIVSSFVTLNKKYAEYKKIEKLSYM